jgi:hypothetical protein
MPTKEELELQEKARQGPAGFLNIGRVLEANQGAGSQMANALAGDARAQGAGVQNDLEMAKEKFGAASQSGSVQGPATGVGENPYNPFSHPKEYAEHNAGVGSGYEATRGQYGSTGQGYQGPNSIGEMDPELAGRARDAGQAAKNLGTNTGRLTATRQKYGKGTGYYSSQGAGMDAFLAGATGEQTLSDTAKEFGGLEDQFEGLNAESAAEAEELKAQSAANEKLWDQYDQDKAKYDFDQKAPERAAADEKARKEAEQKAKVEGRGAKKESWEEYSQYRPENALRTASEYMNPVDWILNATGNKTMTQAITPQVEAGVNGAIGSTINSSRIDWQRELPDSTPDERRAIYESMTADDLKKVEGMSHKQQAEWLAERRKAIKFGSMSGGGELDAAMEQMFGPDVWATIKAKRDAAT